ncbi:MAG TPA: hypothetical protein VGL94_22730 [Ktedonobacteraceae bacterium]|jgi:hypothetical protein
MEQIPQPDMVPQAISITEQLEPSKEEVAALITNTLGETEESTRKHILHIVRAVGRTAARELLNMTLQTEEHGGLLVPDESRRRTPGGVFFHLAYTIGKTKSGQPLRPFGNKKPKKEQQAAPSSQPQQPMLKQQFKQPKPMQQPAPAPVFLWDNRITAVKEAENEKGQANVKITVIGRPGKIVDKGQCIVTVMESTKVPTLPKGLPTPTSVPTAYVVYIASKQWKKVEEAIKDPEDTLIIEGFPKTDPEVSAIAVFTTNVTTKKLQMAKKQSSTASS